MQIDKNYNNLVKFQGVSTEIFLFFFQIADFH